MNWMHILGEIFIKLPDWANSFWLFGESDFPKKSDYKED